MIITTPPAPSQVTPTQGGSLLQFATLEITDWNMETTEVKEVAHNLTDVSKVVNVQAMIFRDSDETELGMTLDGINFIDYGLGKGRLWIDETYVRLERYINGGMANTAYNAAGFRGRIFLTLIV